MNAAVYNNEMELMMFKKMFRNCFALMALVLAGPTADSCDDEKLEKRPPPGENGVGPDGVHFENPPASTNPPPTQTPTVNATVGVPGANVTVTVPVTAP